MDLLRSKKKKALDVVEDEGIVCAGCRPTCSQTSHTGVSTYIYVNYCFNRLLPHLMREGILEVVIVSAKGIGHTNIIGTPAYYVNIECGNQMQRSKVSKVATNGDNRKEVFWNEKFIFEFPSSELKHLSHLKFKVMDKELFTDGGFVGETIVHLKGLIAEGNEKGVFEIRPTLYNVVLEDDTYKGEIKIGLKFISNKEARLDARSLVKEEEDLGESICKTFMKVCKIPWMKFLSFYETTNSEDKPKQY